MEPKINVCKAICEFQLQNPHLYKNKTATVRHKAGGMHSYKYTSLDEIMKKIRKPLADLGLIISHDLIDAAKYCITRITHAESGELVEISYPTFISPFAFEPPPPASPNAKPAPIENHQTMAQKMTSARRHGICLLLGLAPDEDLDGGGIEDNSNNQEKITAPDPADIAKLEGCKTLDDLAAMWERGFTTQQRKALVAVKNRVKEALLDKQWEDGTFPTGPEKEKEDAPAHA